MTDNRTVRDMLERVRERRRRKRCPDCDGVVGIRGFDGDYRWECLDCDAIGIGYATRGDALRGIGRRHG
ncbi:hypothetical protein [Halobiforma nitratireducens]|uniref:Uncharacterized protein n=1 Tax=Halobiforma nitratireducens JCM 10879 TaxID=1227454 RepID=M0MCC3_9EURY|nr:hypothetical protein [Halobiforma nitratireducens]EMA42324.1 hypothetical protein C446_04325 [Halobiforma nitratireducens JCM 10879]